VSAIMTAEVVSVAPQRSIEECLALMTERRIRHLPVIENRRLVGVISIGDLVKAMIDEQEFTIRELKSYIAS
jgi:CBS domain-containing protein